MSFKPTNHMSIKGPNEQKADFLFYVLTSCQNSFLRINLFLQIFGLLITWQSFFKLFKYINDYIRIGQTLKREPEVLS